MSSGWQVLTLAELTINHDTKRKPVKGPDRKPGPYPYYGASGIVDYVDGYLFDGDFLLIAEDGENLRTRQTPIAFMASGKFWVNNHAHIVTGNERASTRFLMYSLLTADVHSFLTGAVMPKLTQGNLNKIPIACPPRETQEEIVSILGSLDDKIALLRETNTTLESIAQALFKSWFVDFYPVRAKAEGREPEGITPEVAALFPSEFEDSELGEIPKGWKVMTVGENTSYLNRGISPKYTEEGGVLVINQKCIRDFILDFSKARRHNATQRKIDGRELSVGDILVNSTGVGTLGRVAQVLALDEPAIVDSHVTVVRAGARMSWNYLGLAFMRKQGEIEGFGEGTTGQTELSKGKLAGIKLIVPLEAVLQQFDETTLPLRQRFAANLKQAQTLDTLRDTLLPRLISGKLRLTDSESIEEAA